VTANADLTASEERLNFPPATVPRACRLAARRPCKPGSLDRVKFSAAMVSITMTNRTLRLEIAAQMYSRRRLC